MGSYHSGNPEGFSTFVPGTGDKDQIYFLLYHSGERMAHSFQSIVF